MNYNNLWNFIYFLVAIPFLARFFGFSSSGNPLYLVTGSMGIILLLLILRGRKYFNKILFLVLIALIIVSGIIIGYVYLFKPIYTPSSEYYYAIGTLIIYIISLIYAYSHKKDLNKNGQES